MNIGIIGLGLIGGSLAKSIKSHTDHTVTAFDINGESMLLARMCGAIDETLNENNVAACDLIFLAIRPQAAINWVRENADRINKKTTVVDMCGVKRVVCEAITPIAREYGFGYIGGHPMAGTERGGFVSSTPELFVGASMILTPDEATDMPLLEKLKELFTDIGFANLTFSKPDEHDRIIAYTSQLAHVVSSAYVKSPEALRRRGFSAGSFRDMTRVARLDEDMWTELFTDDSDYLTEQLEILIGHLNEYLDVLKNGNPEKLKELLKDGRECKALTGGV